MSKHGNQAAYLRQQQPAAEPPKPTIKLRLHFQRSVNARISEFAGVQGLGTWDTDSSKILMRDSTGMLLDLNGKCAFVPWSNIAWVECL